jgi:hypothetical protein
MTSESTPPPIKIHDSHSPRPQKLHGPTHRTCLSPPSRINRTPLLVPRIVQTKVADPQCRFREHERKDLDRHSYEIQIKELSQKVLEESSFRIENGKLKEFLKSQTVHSI